MPLSMSACQMIFLLILKKISINVTTVEPTTTVRQFMMKNTEYILNHSCQRMEYALTADHHILSMAATHNLSNKNSMFTKVKRKNSFHFTITT